MISTHIFGKTGHESSRLLLGAAAFGRTSQAESDASLELALAAGVNHVDVAASYGGAELRVGDWIRRHGRPFFLATKTEKRTRSGAWDEIQRSLEKLQVSQVDLIQLHVLIDPEEWETALGPGGALEATVEARRQGLVRFIGVTGHGVTAPVMHRRALERFDFDSVLLPWSYTMAQNPQYRADYLALVELCRSRDVAIQTIKAVVHSPWGDHPRTRATWYRPLEDQHDIDLATHWVLGQEGLFLNTVGDTQLLPRVLDAAARFEKKPDDADMQVMMERLAMEPLFV